MGSKKLLSKIDTRRFSNTLLIDIFKIHYLNFQVIPSDIYWFASPIAIEAVIKNSSQLSLLQKAKWFGVVGDRCQRSLLDLGVSLDKIMVYNYLEELVTHWKQDGKIVFFRVSGANKDYQKTPQLINTIIEVPVYATMSNKLPDNFPKIQLDDKLVFTSPKSFVFFLSQYKSLIGEELDKNLEILVLGKTTYQQVVSLGFNRVSHPQLPKLDWLLKLL